VGDAGPAVRKRVWGGPVTAPLDGPSEAMMEAAKVAAEYHMTGGAYDDAIERAALDALTAAWPLIVAEVRAATIRECAMEAAYREGFRDGVDAACRYERGGGRRGASHTWPASEAAERLFALLPSDSAGKEEKC
jgi:hypothetical protein